jgi:hypothetical protein
MKTQASTTHLSVDTTGGKVFLCQLTNTNLLTQQNRATATTKDETMINDKDATAQAQALHRAACERMRVKPRETVGEVMFAEGLKIAVLFDSSGKLAAVYRISGDRVVDLDGHELVKLRSKLMHRKAR